MKYEICKLIKDGDIDLYTSIAWKDVYAYTKRIEDDMNALENDKYVTQENGKVIV